MLQRWLNLSGKILAANFGRLDAPFKLTFVVTKECHSKCVNCLIWQVKPSGELTLDEIRQFAKNSPYLSWIDFTGGEPTDRDDFVELVGAFVENCPHLLFVHFPTNGLKTKRIAEMAQRIASLRGPRLVVSVSIDGPREVNDRLRGIPGDFERAVDTFARLKELKRVRSYIGMTLYRENVSLIEQTVSEIQAKLPSFHFRDLHVNLSQVSPHFYENSAIPLDPTPEMNAAIDRLMKRRGMPRSLFDFVERMYHRRVRQYLATRECPQDCASLMASVYLSEQGTVYPCLVWNEPLGNIRDTNYSLEPILRSSRAGELRRQLLLKQCPNCWTPCEAYQTLASNILKWN